MYYSIRKMIFLKKKYFKFLFLLIFIGGIFSFNAYSANQGSDKLRVIFFDVGQGDSVFIQTPFGEDILIDGGPDNKVLEKLSETMPFYDRKIDVIILTHAHADHLAGLVEVLKRYEVGSVYYNGLPPDSDLAQEFFREIKEKKINLAAVRGVKRPEEIKGVSIDIFSPEDDFLKETTNVNNASLITKVFYGDDSFLFTGDAEIEEWEHLLSVGYNFNTDVLKVAHHGSSNGTVKSLLKEVSPEIAVISVGKGNDFGHPSLRVIKKIKSVGAKIYRTDTNGDIKVTADGSGNYNIVVLNPAD